MNYRKTIYTLLCKEKRERRGKKAYLKKKMAENVPNLGRDWNSKFMKLVGTPKVSA